MITHKKLHMLASTLNIEAIFKMAIFSSQGAMVFSVLSPGIPLEWLSCDNDHVYMSHSYGLIYALYWLK